MEKPVLYLVDGSAYIHRAFHAIKGLADSNGMPTNAVFGFTRMLLKLMEERAPRYATIVFDAKGPTFRHRLYNEYKANRPPMPPDLAVQIPFIKKIAKHLGWPAIEMEGFEADDLIGTLARQAEALDFSVVLVSSDKDLMQIVSPDIVMLDPWKDKIVDKSEVISKTGVSPQQIVEMMALSGDSSDNIPGVPGIGPKTATRLIQNFKTIENLYRHIDEIKQKKLKQNLKEFKEQALLSKKLVTIATDAPVRFDPAGATVTEPERESLFDLFTRLEFNDLARRFTGETKKLDLKYEIITSTEGLERMAQELAGAGCFALDTETTSQHPMKAEIVGISFSCQPFCAFYVPCGHDDPGSFKQLELREISERIGPLLADPEVKKVGQNIKYDWIVLERNGLEIQGLFFDTMLASYLLDPSKRSHGLDRIARDFLGRKTTTYSEVAGKGKQAVSFSKVPVNIAGPYACEDAEVTWQAFSVLESKLEESGLIDLFFNVEMPLVKVLKRMEVNGVKVDTRALAKLSQKMETRLKALERQIFAEAGEEFNIKSSQQLGRILFDRLGLPVKKKTKKTKGYSTDTEVLQALSDLHPLPALILEHRGLAKLKSTYTDALIKLVHPETGRIHTSFNQTVTATGRLSSSEPNLQNIPVRTGEGREIRKAFVPEKGNIIVSADYSQIELRILAHYSKDPLLIEAFERDDDIHLKTAAEVFGLPQDMISEELRRQAKAINFGIIYGMSPFGLARDLSISRQMAKTYIDNYFARYTKVKAFIEEAKEEARETGFTTTLLGRRRFLPEIKSSNPTVRAFAERMAVNTPIQGSAADLIKLAMISIDKGLLARKMASMMILTVHDELVFEAPEGEAEELVSLVRESMENVFPLEVPLKVNINKGGDWAAAH